MPLNSFHFKDLSRNSRHCPITPNSYDLSSENLVLDQLIIPLLVFFSFLISCLFDIVLNFLRKNSVSVTRCS